MAKTGERHGHGDNLPSVTRRNAKPPPTLADLGFTRPRAWRWELAGQLPQKLYKQYQRETLSPDGILAKRDGWAAWGNADTLGAVVVEEEAAE